MQHHFSIKGDPSFGTIHETFRDHHVSRPSVNFLQTRRWASGGGLDRRSRVRLVKKGAQPAGTCTQNYTKAVPTVFGLEPGRYLVPSHHTEIHRAGPPEHGDSRRVQRPHNLPSVPCVKQEGETN